MTKIPFLILLSSLSLLAEDMAPVAKDTKTPVAPAKEQAATTPKKTLRIPKNREDALKLQIFLDQKHFGPGIIDGKPGLFTKLAIENYNTALGRDKKDLQVVEESQKAITDAYATAIIPSFVDKYVDRKLPRDRKKQAEVKYMAYRSITEFMAERYHTTEDLLIELNGYKKMRNAKPRSAIKVPNITPFQIENLRVGRSHGKDETLSARHLVVDTKAKQIYIYELQIPETPRPDGKPQAAKPQLIASFPITPGKTQFIPTGFWNLKNSVELPEWRYDKKLLTTGVRGKEYLKIPAGPNNPVGIIWNGLTKSGIGIHGTNNPQTIGRARSAGCIRMANWDAARIPTLVRPGAVVVVK